MIFIEKEKVLIQGEQAEVLAELTVVMKHLIDNGSASEDELAHCVALATFSDSELEGLDKKFREAVALASMLFGEIE